MFLYFSQTSILGVNSFVDELSDSVTVTTLETSTRLLYYVSEELIQTLIPKLYLDNGPFHGS